MKNKITWILVLFLLSISLKVNAQDVCSRNGYTILTINGIFTNEKGAVENRDKLKSRLSNNYNNEPLYVDYVYNQTHAAGIGDLADVIRQGLFDPKSDYDLVEMLNDASNKVKTQKLLIVGHSQGNFYANNFYDKVAGMDGGVPSESIGVYSVATPDKRVAGGGKYITSDTDKVISTLVGRLKTILTPNTHIIFSKDDDSLGHDFAGVYLKYRSSEIVSDIKSELGNLKDNNIQDSSLPCISPVKISLAHKITGVVLATSDFIVNQSVKTAVLAYDAMTYPVKVIANVFSNLSKNNLALVSGVDNNEPTPVIQDTTNTDSILDTSTDAPKENQIVDNNTTTDNPLPPVDSSPATDQNPPELVQENNKQETQQQSNTNYPSTNTTDEIISNDENNNTTSTNDSVDANTDSDNNQNNADTTGNDNDQSTDNGNNDGSSEQQQEAVDINPPIISLIGNSNIILKVGDTYTELGATATDDVDGNIDVITSGVVDTSTIGTYTITYTATDKSGNFSSIIRTVKVSSYVYIPSYTFGKNNGDGNNWQVWFFNGSYVYDWTDTYSNDGYLVENFKIQTGDELGVYSGDLLQRGIFNHDPTLGFEKEDLKFSNLEDTPQNNMNDTIYNVSMKWDSTGYTYKISYGENIYHTGHVDVPNMNNDLWVGWDVTQNQFQKFPYGNWDGVGYKSPYNRTGGRYMIVKPYPVYNETSIGDSSLDFKDIGLYAGNGISQSRGRENLTDFSFGVVYKDNNNKAPQNVELHMIDNSNGDMLPAVEMTKDNSVESDLNDGDFTNGELYTTGNYRYENIDYDYYFTALDSKGNSIRIPGDYNLNFSTTNSTYKYIPQYSFGIDDEGRNWQVWAFNGSSIYDWIDSYKDGYLHEQFKIKTQRGYYSFAYLQRGIFNHDPTLGFEKKDFTTSLLENDPQNNMNDTVYDISIQWDQTGYTYTISHDGIVDSSGHTDVQNISNNTWVGWDDTGNGFKNFPSGTWRGTPYLSPDNMTGGDYMILKPYPIYDLSATQEESNSNNDTSTDDNSNTNNLSSEKNIISFSLNSMDPVASGVIDEENKTINISVPYGTDITSLSPTIVVSDKAQISPTSLDFVDFTDPVIYTVTAEDGSTITYTANVTVLPNPNPTPVLPIIESYTLNGIQNNNITLDPTIDNVTIDLIANKNVNWMSIKIEKADDISIYKIFYSDTKNCIDGTNTCSKIWDGTLSSGELLQSGNFNGNYRIKVHMKDDIGNEYEDYLPYYIYVESKPI